MEPRIIDVKLERNEWIMLNFIIGYSNKLIIWITIVGLGMLYTVIDYLTWNSFNTEQFPIGQLAFAILILGVIPVATYINSAKNIKSNPWVSEKARYTLESTKISAKGDTYEVNINWTNIKSLKEIKHWFVIYTETNRGFFIPKRVFKSKEDLNKFRNELKMTPVTKKKLK